MAQAFAVPSPTAFLDPLTEINSCFLYAVPRFFPAYHSNTRWLLAIVRSGNADQLKRRMEHQPSMFKSNYYQLSDDPQRYDCRNVEVHSLFHKQAVLYLTAVGVAMFFRSMDILKLLLDYRDPSDEKLYELNDPQYATHVLDTTNGDFHAYPLSMMVLRGGFYESAPIVLAAGWNPTAPICMPMRRRYERRAYYYRDWLDYALCLMREKPLIPIAKLVFHMIRDANLYELCRMPLKELKPPTIGTATGLIDVEELPEEAQMLGTKSLLEVAIDYDRYLQIKQQHRAIQGFIKEMAEDGVDIELEMARALDYDGYDETKETGNRSADQLTATIDASDVNVNNNAAKTTRRASKRQSKSVENKTRLRGPYISEPTRVLLHAVHMNAGQGCKTPLSQILDAVSVYLRRNVYIIMQPKGKKSSKGLEAHKLYFWQKRDARNAIVLLLNLMQLQINNLNKLNKILSTQKKPKFKHVDAVNHVFSKRLLLIRVMRRIRSVLLEVLLHSGEFVDFIKTEYPPYRYSRSSEEIDFPLCPRMEWNFRTIQLELMAEFSSSNTSPTYLDHPSLYKAARINELFVNLRVGEAPSDCLKCFSHAKRNRNPNVRRTRNASNAADSASGDDASSAQLKSSSNMVESEDTAVYNVNLLSGETANYLRDAGRQLVYTGGRVTFVKVKRKQKQSTLEKVEELEEATESGPKLETEASTGPATVPGSSLAMRVADQIAELDRCAHMEEGTDVTPRLLEIYKLILDDLGQIATGIASLESGATEDSAEMKAEAETGEGELGRQAGSEAASENDEQEEQEEDTRPQGERRKKSKKPRGCSRKPWLCGARSRKQIKQQQQQQQQQRVFQKARVFDTAPRGSEFAL